MQTGYITRSNHLRLTSRKVESGPVVMGYYKHLIFKAFTLCLKGMKEPQAASAFQVGQRALSPPGPFLRPRESYRGREEPLLGQQT